MEQDDYNHDESMARNLEAMYGEEVVALIDECLEMEKVSSMVDQMIRDARAKDKNSPPPL